VARFYSVTDQGSDSGRSQLRGAGGAGGAGGEVADGHIGTVIKKVQGPLHVEHFIGRAEVLDDMVFLYLLIVPKRCFMSMPPRC
jgi:hypothetical protein